MEDECQSQYQKHNDNTPTTMRLHSGNVHKKSKKPIKMQDPKPKKVSLNRLKGCVYRGNWKAMLLANRRNDVTPQTTRVRRTCVLLAPKIWNFSWKRHIKFFAPTVYNLAGLDYKNLGALWAPCFHLAWVFFPFMNLDDEILFEQQILLPDGH